MKFRLNQNNNFIVLVFIIIMLFLSILVSADEENIDFKIGDLIQFGTYNNEPVLWYISEIDLNGDVKIVTREIITIKAFNASANQNNRDAYYSYALHYGSNNWEESTLRKWLNSSDKKINWEESIPSPENIFKGENSYEEEPGFLNSDNFNSNEIRAIVETSYNSHDDNELRDLVFLLSFDEYMELIENKLFYPFQIPTREAIAQSSYSGRDLKSGSKFSIWTRDPSDNIYATHAVKAISRDGKAQAGVASAGRNGVVPAMILDQKELKAHYAQGDGSPGNPYRFSFKGGFIINIQIILIAITIVAIVFALIGIIRYRYERKRKRNIDILGLFLIATLMMYLAPSYANPSETSNENYSIIQNYALNKDRIMKRMDQLQESDDIIIIDLYGNDVIQDIVSRYFKDKTLSGKENFLNKLIQGGFYLVRQGDFRITNFAKEVEGVINGEHYLVSINEAEIGHQVVNDKQLNEEFTSANYNNYIKKDYDAIKDYLAKNKLTIRHPSDTSNTGIPTLLLN